MATDPIFTTTPVIGMATISTANTAKDGTGTLGTVITGASGGTRITRLTIIATGTTTAGMVRLFIQDNSGTTKLWKEVSITALTPSATVAGFNWSWEYFGERAIILPLGWSIKAATNNAESFNVIAEGGNY